ncbi:hypothetical protein AAVH_06598 [Aphelenchoides avenae]|nr:hypothetical protein AAVH_06598 [Aphelenchus avenae]
MTNDRLSTIHHRAESVVSATALIFNTILLYLIVRHSQFREKSNKFILLMSCVADIWLALVVFLGQPMVLAGRGWMILVANGFFATKSAFFDHISIAIYCASIHTSMVIVVIQFYCRYRIVCRSNELVMRAYFFPTLLCLAPKARQ